MGGAAGRFAVGEPSIDQLHEECEALIVELDAAISARADASVALGRLHEHLAQHFAHEESLMASTSFPPAACHQREHASVLEVVVEVQRRYALGDHDPALRLPAAMFEWFGIHASSMDVALAGWLTAARDAAPVEPSLG